jgi:CRP-like cAMP-binding protein
MGHTASIRSLPLDRRAGTWLPDELGVRKPLQRGQTLVAQGAPSFGLVFVRRGLVFESSVSPEGRSTLHDVLGPGDVAGGLPPDRAPASLRAAAPALVQVLEPGLVDAVFARRPAVGAALVRAVARRGDAVRRVAAERHWYGVSRRVLSRLIDLAGRYGRAVPGGVRIEAPITQEQLGALVGATRESVNRALVRLAAAHLVRLEHRRFVVLDGALAGADAIDP